MNLQDIYQQFYFSETERKEHINNSLAIPLGIMSAISTVFIVVAKELDAPFDFFEKAQLCFFVLTAISLVVAIYFLIRAWIGYGYGHMPRANELRLYYKDLENYYLQLELSVYEAKQKAEGETLDYINEKYAEYAEMNSKHNDTKSLYLFRANVTAVLSAVLLGCSSVPYLINEICDPEKPQKIEISNFNKIVESLPLLQGKEKLTKVEIVNLKELQMSENKPTQPAQNQKAPPQEQKPVPQKPTPPQGRVSLEHLEPKKK